MVYFSKNTHKTAIAHTYCSVYFTQDMLQDESLKLDESFTNSFINELSKVQF